VCAPVQNTDEMFKDPQVLARKLFIDVEHPRIGKVKIPRTPLNLSETPSRIQWLDSTVGCSNKEVYGSILKYSEEEVAIIQEEE